MNGLTSRYVGIVGARLVLALGWSGRLDRVVTLGWGHNISGSSLRQQGLELFAVELLLCHEFSGKLVELIIVLA
jgi:hypothetical protein